MKHLSITSFIGIILCILTAGCGAQRTEQQPAAPVPADDFTRITESDTIRIGIKADAKPFSQRIGNGFIGFEADLAIAICGELGVSKIAYVPVTTANRFTALENKQIDILIASTTITRGREEKYDFSIPYFQDGQGLMVPINSAINSYRDLSDTTVGVLRGSTSASNIRQVAPSAQLKEVNTPETLLTMLDSGAVQAITRDTLLLQKWVLDHPEKYRLAGDRFSTEPYGIAMRENQSDLRDAINKALQNLWEDGSWHAIYDTWFGPGTNLNRRFSSVSPSFLNNPENISSKSPRFPAFKFNQQLDRWQRSCWITYVYDTNLLTNMVTPE